LIETTCDVDASALLYQYKKGCQLKLKTIAHVVFQTEPYSWVQYKHFKYFMFDLLCVNTFQRCIAVNMNAPMPY